MPHRAVKVSSSFLITVQRYAFSLKQQTFGIELCRKFSIFSFPCLLSYLLALVETLTKCLYLIAIARQSDNVIRAVMLKVEHKRLFRAVKRYTHILFPLILQRYTIFWKLPNESWKKKPQQMKTVCSLSIEVLNISGSSTCPFVCSKI